MDPLWILVALVTWMIVQSPVRYYAWMLRKRLFWHTLDKLRGRRPWLGGK